MRYCQSCKVVYPQEMMRCPVCDVDLADELPGASTIEWVSLPKIPGLMEAHRITDELDRADIICYIDMPDVLANIMVPNNEYEHALEIQQSVTGTTSYHTG